MKRVLFLLHFLCLSLSAFASSNGIIITYKEKEKKRLTPLHKNFNTRVFYQVKKLPKQVIHSNNAGLNFNDDYLRALCRMYLENDFITKCELNQEVKAKTSDENCTIEEQSPLTTIRGLGDFFSQLGSKSNACSLTNPHNYPNIKSHAGNRKLVGGFDHDQLTPRWAQEYIGADLAYGYMQDKLKSGETLSVKDGVIDTGFQLSDLSKYRFNQINYSPERSTKSDPRSEKKIIESNNHGSAVVSLMLHPSYGVSPVAELSLVKQAVWSSSIIEGIEQAIDNGTQIINMSTDTPVSAIESLRQANEKNIIIVTAAGNDFDDGKKQVDPQYDQYEQILVGSIAPQGYVSVFSQQGKAVTILAPSDFWVAAEANDKEIIFGGTSGASPLVKGALDNVLAQVPELSITQLKILLEKTAIKTISTETKGHEIYNNGVGMINAYRLARVANKIMTITAGLRGNAQKKKINELLQSSSLYQFDNESQELFQNGLELLKSNDCIKRQEGFTLIRKSYFLDNNEAAREKMVEIFLQEDKDVNAEFFKSVQQNRSNYIKKMSSVLFRQHLLHLREAEEEQR